LVAGLALPPVVPVQRAPQGLPQELPAPRWAAELVRQDERRRAASRLGAQQVWQLPVELELPQAVQLPREPEQRVARRQAAISQPLLLLSVPLPQPLPHSPNSGNVCGPIQRGQDRVSWNASSFR
jgi:hypothetical protein